MAEVATPELDPQVDDQFLAQVDDILREELGCKSVKRLQKVEGGLVNQAGLYETDKGVHFVKYADRANAKDLFLSEYEGLRTLQATGIIRVPTPYKVCDVGSQGAMLIMECLHDLKKVDKCWGELGHRLARLHKYNPDLIGQKKKEEQSVHQSGVVAVEQFGFHVPTYYGSMFCTPGGVWSPSWEEYFTRYLLASQFQLMEEQYQNREIRELWSELQLKVHTCFEGLDIKPSLLHGDFCSINCGEIDDQPVTFDPSCSYGHDLFDLIQPYFYPETFDESFFIGYNAIIVSSASATSQTESALKLYQMFFCLLLERYYCDQSHMNNGLDIGRKLLNSFGNIK